VELGGLEPPTSWVRFVRDVLLFVAFWLCKPR
jgi:hypothetical protein